MIRIVLDTNVFVSGIFWKGVPYQILEAWQKKKLALVLSKEILEEYIRVASILEKKYLGIDISKMVELVTIFGELHTPASLDESISRDPDDDKFIACALGANCKLIVSGDKDLLDINGCFNLDILNPAEFATKYLQKR